MTASANNHRPAILLIAAGLVGALLVVTPDDTHTIQDRDNHQAVASRTLPTNGPQTNGHRTQGHQVERPCFIEPFNWDESIDGALPRCHTTVP